MKDVSITNAKNQRFVADPVGPTKQLMHSSFLTLRVTIISMGALAEPETASSGCGGAIFYRAPDVDTVPDSVSWFATKKQTSQ